MQHYIVVIVCVAANGSDSDEEIDPEMIDTTTGPEKSGENGLVESQALNYLQTAKTNLLL